MANEKTRAEVAQERSEALAEQYKNEFDESQKAAIDARGDQPDQAETEEEYYDRVSKASRTGIFGDTDTTAGVNATGTDVPVSDNEAATKAVAAADANAEQGNEDAVADNNDQARRQVDGPTADQVDEGAEVQAEQLGENAPDRENDSEDVA